jgi:mono/diheme cytochrome c family protein
VAIGLLGLSTFALIGLTVFAITTDVRMTEPEQVVAKAPRPPAEPAGPIQRADVAKVYNENCASCHGVDGSGKQIRAGMPTIPDFTSLAWQMSQTDLEITHRIVDGNEPLMPAYRDKLSQQQILALAVYVRAFAVIPSVAGAPKPAQPAPPVTSGMSPALVYRAYCLACHDADGSGRIARKAMPDLPDFTDPKWQTARKDADLKKSILDGKGKFMQPMKDKLSPSDADQMVAYVRAFQGGKQIIHIEPPPPIVPSRPTEPAVVSGPKALPPKQPSVPSPSPELAERTRVAAELFRTYCLSCHGADGRGSEMRASMSTIPDFTSRSWQEGVSVPQLVASILDGKGTLMPAFRGRITDEQSRDLAAFVRAFGPVQGPQPQAPASDFEKQFRELQAHWDALQKQLRELSKPPQKP